MYEAASDDQSPKTTYEASDDKLQKSSSTMQLFDIAMAEKSRGIRGGKIRRPRTTSWTSSSNQKNSSFNDPRLRLDVASKSSFPKIHAKSNKSNETVPGSNLVDRQVF